MQISFGDTGWDREFLVCILYLYILRDLIFLWLYFNCSIYIFSYIEEYSLALVPFISSRSWHEFIVNQNFYQFKYKENDGKEEIPTSKGLFSYSHIAHCFQQMFS